MPRKAKGAEVDPAVQATNTTSRRGLIGIISAAVIAVVGTISAAGINNCGNIFRPGPSLSPTPVVFIGRIIDEKTEAKIRGAKVSLEGESVPSVAYSDSEGIFSFPVTDPDKEMRLRIEANQYENYDLRTTPAKNQGVQDVRLTPKTEKQPSQKPGATLPSMREKMSGGESLQRIRGQVIDEMGAVVPDARVTIAGYGSAVTDASGNFQISVAVARGRSINLNVAKEGFRTKTLEEQASEDALKILLRRLQ
jgi:hypothetical protein